MSASSTACSTMQKECKEWLNIIYNNHNPDPTLSFKPSSLSDTDINFLSDIATKNEILKTSRGNGNGNQTIYSGMTSFGEIPTVSTNTNKISITQQFNVGNGFAYRAPSTWAKRVLTDHLRRNKPIKINNDIFNKTLNSQEILAEPMKINLKPDWNYENKNFLTGQQIDTFYSSLKIWSTKGYFNGSMITPLQDPRQISIIILSGNGIIQTSFGILKYEPGDLIQIPPYTPFCFYVSKGEIIKSVNYYSKEDLLFPDKQLNVCDLNQVPFSPSDVIQCKYSYNEHSQYEMRPEYIRIEQPNGNYNLYYHSECKTAFNFTSWVHNGAILHKVNLIRNYERIGTSKGHKDPNLWVILGHKYDRSFGIAFITGKSFIEIDNTNKITYPPAYFHLNGVQEKGELIVFENYDASGYDARSGFVDGDCLLHVAGVGHGADKDIYKYFINNAIIKYIFQHKNKNKIIKQLINKNKFEKWIKLNNEIKNQRIDGYIKKMYSFNFKNKYNDNENMEFNVMNNINIAIDVILNEKIKLNKNNNFQALGMPFGIGYLLVECRDAPVIPQCEYNSNFRKMTPVQSYGLELYPFIKDANQYLNKINKNFIRSSL